MREGMNVKKTMERGSRKGVGKKMQEEEHGVD